MNIAVRVRRAIVQHKARPPLTRRTDTLIELAFLPLLQHQWLALGQIAAHGEGRVGQIQGVFVISHF